MNAHTRIFIGIAALALCAAAAAAQTPATPNSSDRSPITVTLSDPASPATVRVNLIMGDIVVHGSNRKDVLIEAASRDGDDLQMANRPDPAAAHGLRKLTQSGGFSVEEHDNRIEVRSAGMRQSVNLVIQVPLRANLTLSTVNDGDIRVDNVDGELEISNVNGSVRLEGVGGSIVAHTVNGKVEAKLTRITPDRSLAFTTLNGEVDLTLPAATKATLKLRSDNGDIYSDFDLQTGAAGTPTVTDERRGAGRYRIDVNKLIRGTLNGGGADIEIRTFNGNVYVRKGS